MGCGGSKEPDEEPWQPDTRAGADGSPPMAQPQAQPTSNLAEKVQIICKEIGMPEGASMIATVDMAVAEIGLAAQVQGLNIIQKADACLAHLGTASVPVPMTETLMMPQSWGPTVQSMAQPMAPQMGMPIAQAVDERTLMAEARMREAEQRAREAEAAMRSQEAEMRARAAEAEAQLKLQEAEMRAQAAERALAQQARMAALEKALRDAMPGWFSEWTDSSTAALQTAIAQAEAAFPPEGSSLHAALLEAKAALRGQAEAKARKEAEERAKREAEEKARREAEERARRAAEKALMEAEERAKREAEEKARREEEERARAMIGKPPLLQMHETDDNTTSLWRLDRKTGTWRSGLGREIFHHPNDGTWYRTGTDGRHEKWAQVRSDDRVKPPTAGWTQSPGRPLNFPTLTYLNEDMTAWTPETSPEERAKREAAEKALMEAEERAKREAEEKARREEEERARAMIGKPPLLQMHETDDNTTSLWRLDRKTGTWRSGLGREIFHHPNDGTWYRTGTDGRHEKWAQVRSDDRVKPPTAGWTQSPGRPLNFPTLTYLNEDMTAWTPETSPPWHGRGLFSSFQMEPRAPAVVPAKLRVVDSDGDIFTFKLSRSSGTWCGVEFFRKRAEIWYESGTWTRCGSDGRHEVSFTVSSADAILPPKTGWNASQKRDVRGLTMTLEYLDD